jgi:hypothetical protein
MAKRFPTTDEIRNTIIGSVVKGAREFGYPSCNDRNIITDEVYGMFFESQLNDARQHKSCGETVGTVIDGLLAEIKAARLPSKP